MPQEFRQPEDSGKPPRINKFVMTQKPIGEIIEAGTTAFVAQCLEVPREIVPRLYDPPPFGSFVKLGKPTPILEPIPNAPEPLDAGDEEEDPFAIAFDPPMPALRSGAACCLPCMPWFTARIRRRWSRTGGRRRWGLPMKTRCGTSSPKSSSCSEPSFPAS